MRWRHIIGGWIVVLLLLTMQACRGGDDDAEEYEVQARVTMLVSMNGLGDNGYNDDAAAGVFRYARKSGAKVSLLRPKSIEEAKQMYEKWMEKTTEADSAVLVLGSSSYEELVNVAVDKNVEEAKTGGSRRVILMESTEKSLREGVSSVYVSRGGVCYLAGCMSEEHSAMIIKVGREPIVEVASMAFEEGYNRHKDDDVKEFGDIDMGRDESMFANPEELYSAFVLMSGLGLDMEEKVRVFPLVGGSGVGIVQFLNDNPGTRLTMVGMDVDQGVLSDKVPFSVIIKIGAALETMLSDWREGKEWPKMQMYDMEEGYTEIVVNDSYRKMEWEKDVEEQKRKYYEEAIEIERGYREEVENE
ncbi:MAG: hypothetical protein II951_06345 [Bacteroidales bacterium]|nr:hypothetical protein [Bacteroidales bacterium]